MFFDANLRKIVLSMILFAWLFACESCCLHEKYCERRSSIARKINNWHPSEIDGEGLDHMGEMIEDLKLDGEENSLVIGDVGGKGSLPSYWKIVRLSGGTYISKKDENSVKFRMSAGLASRLKDSAGWGSQDSFTAIFICLTGYDDGLPECVAIQFEGGPFFK